MMHIFFLFLVLLAFANARLGERDSIKEKGLITKPEAVFLRGQNPKSVPLHHTMNDDEVVKKKLNLRMLYAKHAKCVERYAKKMIPSESTTPNDYFGLLVEYWMTPEESFEDAANRLCKKLII